MKSKIVRLPAVARLAVLGAKPAPSARGHSEVPLRPMNVVWVAVAVGLIVAAAIRVGLRPEAWSWPALLLILLAMPVADLISGVIHWALDTWGSERTFWIGPSMIHAFRFHHERPQNLLLSHFLTATSDSSQAVVP